MIDWIIEQTWPISCAIFTVLLSNILFKKQLSAKLQYTLWLLVPLVLIINNLPSAPSISADTQLHQYVVTIATHSKSLDIYGILSAIWLCGFSFLSLLVIYEHFKILSNFNSEKTYSHHFNSTLPVYICKKVSSPLLFGLAKQQLFIPSDFYSRYDEAQIKLIYQHEWVHFKRKDNFSNACAIFLLTIFWFNPLCWLGYNQYRKQQEIACDADVLKHTDKAHRIAYCKALIASISTTQNTLSSYSYYMEKSTMKQRLTHIKTMSKGNTIAGILITLILLAGLTITAFAKYDGNIEIEIEDGKTVTPIVRIEPVYPKAAIEQGIEGSVVLSFTINSSGKTDNIKVVSAEPENIFNKEAKKALKQWQYTSSTDTSKKHLVQLDFALSEDYKSKDLVEIIKVISN